MIGWILLAVMTISEASSDVLLSHGTKQVAQASDLRRWDMRPHNELIHRSSGCAPSTRMR